MSDKAPSAASDAEEDAVDELIFEETVPQYPFDAATTVVVCDLRSLSALPTDPEINGIKCYRALLFVKGFVVHVPNDAGSYATSKSYRMQTSLAVVHFVKATKRRDELLLSFVDMGMLSEMSKGVFVESLQLPLLKSRNIYEETPRFTSVTDVAGFSSIDMGKPPWSTNLKGALQRQQQYKVPKIFLPADIPKHLDNASTAFIKSTSFPLSCTLCRVEERHAQGGVF